MFKTFDDSIHDIEQLYDRREYQKVIISSGKLTEKILIRIFTTFHASLHDPNDRTKFLAFEEEQGKDYAKFLMNPSIGIGIRFYLILAKNFPEHQWVRPEIKGDLNCINRWRNIEAHSSRATASSGEDNALPKDEDAADVLQAVENILRDLDMLALAEAEEGMSLTDYFRYLALKKRFDSASKTEHYVTIVREGSTLSVEFLNILLERVYSSLTIDEKRNVLMFYEDWGSSENELQDISKYKALFDTIQFGSQFENVKQVGSILGRFTPGNGKSASRRATSPYIQLLDLVYQQLTEPGQQTIFRICDRVNQLILESGTLNEQDRHELEGICKYEGISDRELEKIVDLVSAAIPEFLEYFPNLAPQKTSIPPDRILADKSTPITETDISFTEFDELIYGRFAPILIEVIGCIWLNPNYDASGKSFKDCLRKNGGARAVSRGVAAFQTLEESIAELFRPHFLAIKDEVVRINLLKQLLWILENHPPNRRVVDECLRNPRLLYQKLQMHVPEKLDRDNNLGLPEYYDRLLPLTCELVIDLFEGLPSWNENNLMDVLGNQEVLLGRSHQIIDKWRESITSTTEIGIEQFEEEFRREIARRYDELNLFGIDLSREAKKYQLSVAYISLSMEVSNSGDLAKMQDSWPVEDVLARLPRLIVLGDAGQGKTTLMQWLTVMCGRQRLPESLKSWNQKIPFLIRLRTVLDKEMPAVGEITPLMAGEIPTDAVKHQEWEHQILLAGRAIIMIDGFDEVPQEKREKVIAWISNLCDLYPNNRYMLTSRPSSYKKEHSLAELGFEVVKLQLMTPTAMSEFVLHWHRAISLVINPVNPDFLLEEAEKLLDELKQKKSLRLLVTNPLLCGVICALHHDRHGYLPNNRTEIYEATCQMLLERRDLERKVTEEDPALRTLSYTDKRIFLNDVAQWMMMNGKTVIKKDQIRKQFREKINYLPNLREKGLTEESLLEYFLERSGLLQQISSEEIHFAHRTFQEYMAAKEFVDKDSMGFLRNNAGNDYWNETILLALGLCSNNASNQFILDLLKTAQKMEKQESTVQATRLYLLIMRGCDTIRQIHPKLQGYIENKIQTIIPPNDRDKRTALVASGDLSLPFLSKKPKRSAKDDLCCAMTLMQMRSEEAYSLLLDYFSDERPELILKLSQLLRRVDGKILEQTGQVELILRKGPGKFPLKIIEALVGVSRDFRLYRAIPQKHLNVKSGTMVMDLKADFDWYVPDQKAVDFHFSLSDNAYLPSVQHLSVRKISLPTFTSADLKTLKKMSQLETLEIKTCDQLETIPQLYQWSETAETTVHIKNITAVHESISIRRFNDTAPRDLSVDITKDSPEPVEPQSVLQVARINLHELSDPSIKFVDTLSKLAKISIIHLARFPVEPSKQLSKIIKQFELLVSLAELAQAHPFKLSIADLSIRKIAISSRLDLVLKSLVHANKIRINGGQADSANIINDLTPIRKLRRLKILDLSRTRIKRMPRLQELTNLKHLSLSHTNVSELGSISLPPNIVKLDLSFTDVEDLTPLSKLKKLQELNLRETKVKDLLPLVKLKELKNLDIRQTEVKNAAPLAELPNLKELMVFRQVKLAALEKKFVIEKSEWDTKISIKGKAALKKKK